VAAAVAAAGMGVDVARQGARLGRVLKRGSWGAAQMRAAAAAAAAAAVAAGAGVVAVVAAAAAWGGLVGSETR
jgi:fatty acid desaturase